MKKILFILAIICAMTAQAQNEYTPLKQSTYSFDKGAFNQLRCSTPVEVTYTVNDTVAPSVSPIGLNVYVDCVEVRVENNTLFLSLNLPGYMNAPGVNELQINITGPSLTRIEADVKCMLVTVGNQTLESPVSVFASDGANMLLRDRIVAPKMTAIANQEAVIGFFTVDTPQMDVTARSLSIVNLYAPDESGTGHVGKLQLRAAEISTVTVNNTTYDSLTEDKDDGSKITIR